VLLLQPPAEQPGAMGLVDLQNRVWHLLRERGPDTGWPAPTTGDYNIVVVTRDLNIALAQFVGDTGVSAALTEKFGTYPVFPVLDYPLPPDCASLTRVEYTPAGQQTYKLAGLSWEEFDNVTGNYLPNDVGQPYYYRRPFAGYIRLQPQPGPGNFVGPSIGTIVISGTATPGQKVTATLSNGVVIVTTVPYTVQVSDTPATIALALSTAINASPAVTGAGAFYAPSETLANQVNLTSLTAPGTALTYYASLSGAGTLIVEPTTAVNLTPNGDQITFYYSGSGMVLVNPGDTPGIPPLYHIALVYRVLVDYWERKGDSGASDRYLKKFTSAVNHAKAYKYDSDQSTQYTLAGGDDTPDWAAWW